MQNGRGLSGSFLLESPPYEYLDEHFPAKSSRNDDKTQNSLFFLFFVMNMQPITILTDLRNSISSNSLLSAV
jgi:hypothetical protein